MEKSMHPVIITILCLVLVLPLLGDETRDPVDFRKLATYLIDLDGWEATGEAEGQNISMGEFKASEASRDYQAGEKSLEVKIADYTYYPMVKQSLEMMKNFEIDSSEKYVKKLDVNGFVSVLEYEYEDKDARLVVFLGNSILVILEADPIDDRQEIVNIVQQLDLKGLSNL